MDYAYGQQVLEEDYDENYEPTEEEILEYCKVLKLDPVKEKDLMYIAKEGIKAPLPSQWKPVEQPNGSIYYFNFVTGASTWEHPCDEFYRNLLKQEREKRKRGGVGATTGGTARTKSSGGSSNKKKGIKITSVKQNPPSTIGTGTGNGIMKNRGIGDGGGELHMHPAQLMNGTTSLAGRSRAPNGGPLQMSRVGGGGLSSAAQINLREAPQGKLQGSPGHGRLAPLSLGGGKPPPSISGLPLLKAPPSLAPVRIPSAMSQVGSSLGGSLGSTVTTTGAGGDSFKQSSTDPLANSHLRNVNIGNIGISNEFEEEDEMDESKSESDLGGGLNKMGMNLLGVEDLGLKDTEDSTEDVSKELRKIMELSEASDDMDEPGNEFLKRPGGIGIPPPSPPVVAVGGGIKTKAVNLTGEAAVSSPRLQRPGAAKSRDRSNSGNKETLVPDQPTTPGKSSLQAPFAPVVPLSIPPGGPGSGVAAKVAAATDSAAAVKPLLSKEIPPRQADVSREAQLLVAGHKSTIEELKKAHAEERAKVEQQFLQELKDLKESLSNQNESSLDSFRKKLATEQRSEEKQLRAQKETFLNELRLRIKEEGDEEEAKLMEAKQDTIRKLKQQITVEQEREERQLKEAKEKALSNLRKEIQDQQSKEESQVRSSNAGELVKLKERLSLELTEERRKMESSNEEELEAIRQRGEEELKEKKEVLEREHQKQREALQAMEDKQQKALEEARADLEKAHNLEEFKAKALLTHKQAQEEMEAELALELENKKAALNEKHQAEIVTLKEQLAQEIGEIRKEENEKLNEEKEKISQELESIRNTLTREHEETMQQLQAEYESAQKQLQQLKEEQLQEIESLKSEYDAECEELSRAKCEVEEQMSELESRRSQLQAREEELKADEERLEKLRSANAKETEQLLQKQQIELRKSVDKEKKRLDSVKKSCGTVENELQQLSQQKDVLLAELGKLKREEQQYRSQLSDLKSQVKGQLNNGLAKKSQKMDAKNFPLSARNGARGETTTKTDGLEEGKKPAQLSNGFTHVREDGKAKKATTVGEDLVDGSESESEEEEEEMTAGSIRSTELAQKPKVLNGLETSTKHQEHPSDSEDSSVLLSSLQTRLTEKNRELHQTLQAEQDSLVKTKAYLRQQQETLKQRRVALKRAHKDWNGGTAKSSKTIGTAVGLEDGNSSLLQDIRSKLDQEATALSELEERVKSSNHLLAKKEQAISQLQASLAQQLEEMSSSGEEETEHTPSPSPPPPPAEIMSLDFDIPSPKTYLAKLKASLEKSTRHRNSKSKHLRSSRHHSSRKRHLTSPLSIRVPSRNGRRLSEYQGGSPDDDDEDGLSQSSDSPSSSSSESITLTTIDIGRSKRATSSSSPVHSHFSPVSKGILGSAAGRVTAWDQPTIHRSTNNGGNASLSTSLLASTHHHMHNGASSSGDEKSDIMSSLQMINGQLGELLCRLGPSQTLTSPAAATTAPLVLPHYARYSPSPVSSFLVGDIGASLHQHNSTLLNTSGNSSRWAEPVPPQIDHIDLELQRKRQSYLGTHSSRRTPQPQGTATAPTLSFGSTSFHHQPERAARAQPSASTETLAKTQTDWLKEFRQNVPLSSQLKLTWGAHKTNTRAKTAPSTALTHSQHLHSANGMGRGAGMGMGLGNSGLGDTSVGQPSSRPQLPIARPPTSSSSSSSATGSTLLPNKPKLVLDGGSGVQLVHI